MGRSDCAHSKKRWVPLLAVSVDNHHVTQLESFRLKVFRTVAEHLNFRKAAEHLFLTQPAITLQVKAPEDDLGIRLFDRASNRVSLLRKERSCLTMLRR